MPLTPFQKEVMSVLAAERHEASHMACGKDAGFNPLSLFQMVMRFARIDPVDLDKIKARHLDPVVLKQELIVASDQAL